MISVRPAGLAPALAAVALSLALGGCVSLFPKAEPEQLYRFGGAPTAVPSAPNVRFTVLNDNLTFDRAASGDRILTTNGTEVAYIKGGRWATAAPMMFREAEQRAFEASGGPARLVERGEAAKVDYILRLDVHRFEARYENGPGTAPTVVVRVTAVLSKYGERTIVREQQFNAEVAASDNRVGAISQAFDQAAGQVLGQIVSWTGQAG